MTDITAFRGDFEWLSNFYPAQITYQSTVFPTVEHAYVAAKNFTPEVIAAVLTKTAGQAKTYGKSISVRPDWDTFRISLMRELIHKKFQIPELRQRLVDTGDCSISEGNHWNDRFWGIDLKTGQGLNWLGHLIMEERTSITGQHHLFIY